jgi:hypothetical protein
LHWAVTDSPCDWSVRPTRTLPSRACVQR